MIPDKKRSEVIRYWGGTVHGERRRGAGEKVGK